MRFMKSATLAFSGLLILGCSDKDTPSRDCAGQNHTLNENGVNWRTAGVASPLGDAGCAEICLKAVIPKGGVIYTTYAGDRSACGSEDFDMGTADVSCTYFQCAN
jgi:hypothetical protein